MAGQLKFGARWLARAIVAMGLALGIFAQEGAAAQSKPVIIGTLGTGSINYAGAVALADILNKYTDLKASALPQSGMPALLSLLKEGAIHVGTVSAPVAQMANTGTRLQEGRQQDLRLLHPLYSVEQALLVAADTEIRAGADLAGKKVSGRYTGDPGTELGILGHLANRGLSYEDVVVVPVPNYPESVKSVIERRADVVASGLTSPLIQQLHAARGFRVIPADTSPEAVARTREAAPGFSVAKITKSDDPSLKWLADDPEVPEELTLLQYWFYFVVTPDLDEEIAYKINKAVWEHHKELAPVQIKFGRDWTPEKMTPADATVPYHPGAVRFFKEVGAWTDELEKNQQELLR
ncbi:MAG: TAXI family TRAP transporter solute-binding subunit [Hyphomicrobiales bacterium]|nr:TAXI family TRAP transporter solute-binding subunit [Hyphomicrobiales bacterium]